MTSLPTAPQGPSKRAAWYRKLINYLSTSTVLGIYGFQRKETAHGVLFIPLGGVSNAKQGWHFSSKIEADETQSYPAQTVIHIQSTHALVTTGYPLPSAPSGAVVKAKPGIWVSLRAVPAKTLAGAVNVYDVPQWPLPVATNLDDETNFWLYLGDIWCA
jgi:hypothetical protein